jgi:hypothetical protein
MPSPSVMGIQAFSSCRTAPLKGTTYTRRASGPGMAWKESHLPSGEKRPRETPYLGLEFLTISVCCPEATVYYAQWVEQM